MAGLVELLDEWTVRTLVLCELGLDFVLVIVVVGQRRVDLCEAEVRRSSGNR